MSRYRGAGRGHKLVADGCRRCGLGSTTTPDPIANAARVNGVAYPAGTAMVPPRNLTLELGNYRFALVLWGVPDASSSCNVRARELGSGSGGLDCDRAPPFGRGERAEPPVP